MNNSAPQQKQNFPDFRNVAHAPRAVKQMRCTIWGYCCLFGYKGKWLGSAGTGLINNEAGRGSAVFFLFGGINAVSF